MQWCPDPLPFPRKIRGEIPELFRISGYQLPAKGDERTPFRRVSGGMFSSHVLHQRSLFCRVRRFSSGGRSGTNAPELRLQNDRWQFPDPRRETVADPELRAPGDRVQRNRQHAFPVFEVEEPDDLLTGLFMDSVPDGPDIRGQTDPADGSGTDPVPESEVSDIGCVPARGSSNRSLSRRRPPVSQIA